MKNTNNIEPQLIPFKDIIKAWEKFKEWFKRTKKEIICFFNLIV